ncbi:MAG: acyl-CoA dehydrogenase family protein [Deltaproteobacteria bacterium]|nr:acyl-CoA dehydrogenase family protein [Deltaproteobacteria bacterium]
MSKSANPFLRVLNNFEEAARQIVSAGSNPEELETIDILKNAIARFGQKYINDAEIDAASEIPPEAIKAAAEMGLFGISIEEQYDGAGLSMKATCSVIEALSRLDRSLGVSIGLHAGLGLRGLNYFGSRELKQTYLPRLASGELIACFSVTESEAGSDIASVRTTAIEDGDQLVINGSKIYATNGGFANLATIIARTPGLGGSRRGHSMILVPLDSPGIQRDSEEHKLGIKGSSTCSLHFEDVRVGIDHIIGTPARGLDHLNHVLSWGRTLMAAGCIGLARTAFERTLEQVTVRRQFNRMIGEFGMVRQMVADMRTRIHAMESVIRLCTQSEDQKPDSIGWESSVAKIYCSESAWQIADDTVQLHGGSGYIEETGVARLLRDCRITRIFEGANELLRFHMAAAAFSWKSEQFGQARPLSKMLDQSLSKLGGRFDSLLRRFAESLVSLKKKYGLKVFQRQMDQRRIADAAQGLYLMLALLARAQGELKSGRLTDEMLVWTEYSLTRSADLIEHSLGHIDSVQNELASRIAAGECERIGSPLKENIS